MSSSTPDPAQPGSKPGTVDARLAAAREIIHDGPVPPLPETPTMADLLEKYGDRWQIETAEPTLTYIGVRRPTPTRQEIITGHTLGELARKLAAED